MDFRFVTRNSDFFAPSDKVYPRLRLGELAPVLRQACAFGRGYTPADIIKMPPGSPENTEARIVRGTRDIRVIRTIRACLCVGMDQTIRIRDS